MILILCGAGDMGRSVVEELCKSEFHVDIGDT